MTTASRIRRLDFLGGVISISAVWVVGAISFNLLVRRGRDL
jgi:hypothetical protein